MLEGESSLESPQGWRGLGGPAMRQAGSFAVAAVTNDKPCGWSNRFYWSVWRSEGQDGCQWVKLKVLLEALRGYPFPGLFQLLAAACVSFFFSFSFSNGGAGN